MKKKQTVTMTGSTVGDELGRRGRTASAPPGRRYTTEHGPPTVASMVVSGMVSEQAEAQ